MIAPLYAAADHRIRLRRVPHPYRAMLAICSDIDQTRLDTFREIHRFINTCEETSLGRGLGLDISDSCWMYKAPFTGNPLRDAMSYFAGYSWDAPSPYAAEMIHYMKCGWIDTLHSYGNFNLQGDNPAVFTREHAQRALGMLDKNDIRLRVWVNHGDRNNRQNIGVHDFMEGDKPASPAYHADLLRAYGVEFLWRTGQSYWIAAPSALVKFPLADGSPLFGFRRYQLRANLPEAPAIGPLYDLNHGRDKNGIPWLQVWRPQGLHHQLDDGVLRAIVDDEHLSVLGQHLGSLLPLLGFDKNMTDALRRLRRFQDEGKILVARTSRLLHYNRVRDHLRFVVREFDDRRLIDIRAVVDPVRGRWTPQLADLRGITFEAGAGRPVQLWLDGKPLDPSEIVAEPVADGSGTIGIRWFEPDPTDYAAPFLAQRRNYVLWSKAAQECALDKAAGLQTWLAGEADAPPSDVDPGRYAAVIRHASASFERLAHSIRVFEQLGFVETRLGLDLGCGPGQWCLAFLEHNRGVVGIDARRECVELARRAAAQFGAGERAQFLELAAERVDYSEDSFDCVWGVARLMYTEAEPVIERVARALTIGGAFYCTYNHLGGRLRIIRDALAGGPDRGIAIQLAILVNAFLHRCGVHHTAGSRVRLLDFGDLMRLCRVFGLHYVAEPGLQDGPGSYLGFPGSFDFLVRKRKPHDAIRTRLAAGVPLGTDWSEDLAELSQAGAPGLVCAAIRAVDPDLCDPALFDLYARALIRTGAARGEAAAAVFEARGGELPELTIGLYRHDQGRIAEAAEHYQRLASGHPDRAFLIGACALQMREWERAAQIFAASIAEGSRTARDFVALAAARYFAGRPALALEAMQMLAASTESSPAGALAPGSD